MQPLCLNTAFLLCAIFQSIHPRKFSNIQTKHIYLRSCLTKHLIILASMKKKRTNPWTIIGIAIAIILLIYWLITATILEEDENVIPILDGTEQVIP
jgi:hypothetical protein